MSVDRAARRRAQLARLLPLADLQAQAARARLGAARRAEAEGASEVERLDRRRRDTLARLDRSASDAGGDALSRSAQADRWLRWYARERAEKLGALARLKAESEDFAGQAGRASARHEILRALEKRAVRALSQARSRAGDWDR